MSEYTPLDGYTVLDLTQSIAGPTATQYLGMLGADIYKVEPPSGDAFRGLLDGAMFSAVNIGNKKSVAIDLKSSDGKEAIAKLAADADVLLESFRPGTVEKFDLDYETVSEYNPEIIYLSLSGYGQDGPRSDWPAYDPAIQAVSGLMSTIGYPDRQPVRIGASVIDMGTGMLSAFLVVSALLDRSKGGTGEYFDASLFETAVSWMGYWIAQYTDTGEVPTQSGQGFGNIVPYEVFDAGDGQPFYLAVINDRMWVRFCAALELDELGADPRFETNDGRWEHRETLRERLREEFAEYDRDTLVETLAAANVPVGPLQTVDELVESDEQIDARELLTDSYNLINDEPVKTTGAPFKTTSGRPSLDDRPPAVGEHTLDVLSKYGYTADELDRMAEEGIIVTAEASE